mmetsp:Transcript_22964/g.54210  ORF Transcript_22964/g.54210 Transcript_22964/m.54210 type:complete len:204 (-) Transcript_22964:1237-1848(-)
MEQNGGERLQVQSIENVFRIVRKLQRHARHPHLAHGVIVGRGFGTVRFDAGEQGAGLQHRFQVDFHVFVFIIVLVSRHLADGGQLVGSIGFNVDVEARLGIAGSHDPHAGVHFVLRTGHGILGIGAGNRRPRESPGEQKVGLVQFGLFGVGDEGFRFQLESGRDAQAHVDPEYHVALPRGSRENVFVEAFELFDVFVAVGLAL